MEWINRHCTELSQNGTLLLLWLAYLTQMIRAWRTKKLFTLQQEERARFSIKPYFNFVTSYMLPYIYE